MHYLFFLLMITTSNAKPNLQETQDATASIKALLAPLLSEQLGRSKPNSAQKFRLDECQKHKINWGEVMLMQKEVSLDYSFKEGCDISGQIRPKLISHFPATLQVRNLSHYYKIESSNTVRPSLEKNPILLFEIRSGVLSGKKGSVKFEADYETNINPLDSKNPLNSTKGGEIRISEIHGKRVNLREKILLK